MNILKVKEKVLVIVTLYFAFMFVVTSVALFDLYTSQGDVSDMFHISTWEPAKDLMILMNVSCIFLTYMGFTSYLDTNKDINKDKELG